jgi:HD-like signal output (HDOD) protein
MGAAWLCTQLGRGRLDHAFLGGLFHDVGQALALRALTTLSCRGLVEGEASELLVDRVLDRVHVELGQTAHLAWNLPDHLTLLCARHHDAEVGGEPAADEIHAVRVVSGLRRLRRARPVPAALAGEMEQSLRALALDAPRFRQLDALVRELGARLAGAA